MTQQIQLKYVANQLTPEGIDEVQQLLLAHMLGQHMALSGPPGVGKTDLVIQFPRIVEQPLFDITCDSFMTEAPLVGWPELEGNGTTSTVWKNGVATDAADKNGILYEDEFDLLPGSVQKRQNSLFDDRRNITRRDGTVIHAKDNFMGIISYNPSDRLSKRQLEEALADRFVHKAFGYLPKELEASLALGNLGRIDKTRLEERGFLKTSDGWSFLRKKGTKWHDCFTDQVVKHGDGAVTYQVYLREQPEQGALTPLSREELADRITDLFENVRSFSETGTNKLKQDVKDYLKEIGEVTSVPLHKPSTRIIKAALKQYDALRDQKMSPEAAQAYAARLCVDQICYGSFGQRALGKVTVQDAITSVAQYHGLVPKLKQATNFTP